jgi:UDP-3-O-[3-hydroxymyristoyl] glucosamine N-acyltransferase
MKKQIELNTIIDFLGSDVLKVYGEPNNIVIHYLRDPQRVDEYTLDWISEKRTNKQELVENSKADAIVVPEEIQYSDKLRQKGKVLIVVANPKMVLAKIGNFYFVETKTAGVHPSAIIHENAIIGKNVYVGAYTVIGNAKIGDNCVIDSNVRIDDGVVMGNNCIIKTGAVLGTAGFGFERDNEGNLFRFPQLGGLVIGNHVEIGANTAVDRGALSNTIIGNYTKINNLCHIAHNNSIGSNVVIAGCVNISGSSTIEDNVWIAPNASIRGWLNVGNSATIGIGAVATKNVPAGETWIGNPARKLEKK